MPRIDLVGQARRLHVARQNLAALWDQAGELWDDPQRDRFEEDFLVPLDNVISAALEGLAHLDRVSAEVERECGR